MTKSRRLFDTLFDLCLSRGQRERHSQYVFDQAVKRSSRDSTPFVTCQNTPVQSRAPSRLDDAFRDNSFDGYTSPPTNGYTSPTSPPQPRYGYSTFSPKQAQIQEQGTTPNYQRPSQLANGYFGNVMNQVEEGKQQIEHQPLLYPIYPIKMQGIGRYRRSENVSETFIDTMLKDKFPTLEMHHNQENTQQTEREPLSPAYEVEEERGHNRRDSEISYISTASSGCISVDTVATGLTSEPSVLMSPGGTKERRDSRGERLSRNLNTTTPPFVYGSSVYEPQLEIVGDCEPNEIKEEDGRWVLYKDEREQPPVRQAVRNGGRLGRLPPPPSEMEFETDDSDDEEYVPPVFLPKKQAVKSPKLAGSAAISIPTPKSEPVKPAAESFESVSDSSPPPAPKPAAFAPPVPKRPQVRRGRRAATTSRLAPVRRTTIQNVPQVAAASNSQAAPTVVRRNTANAVPSDRVVGDVSEQAKPQGRETKRTLTGKGLARRGGGGRTRGKATTQQWTSGMDTLVEGHS